MSIEIEVATRTIGPEVTPHQEMPMVRHERWEEIRWLPFRERVPIAEIARLDPRSPRRTRGCTRKRHGEHRSECQPSATVML
jgi:hypothetical protein